MEKEITKKMARYVELSKKFSKTDSDLFTIEELHAAHVMSNNVGVSGTATLSTGGTYFTVTNSASISIEGVMLLNGKEIFVDEKGNVKSKDPSKPLTRGEQLEASSMVTLKERGKLLDEYDEYLKLRRNLTEYFNGLNKLTEK